jgi:hypothetical protein
MENLPLTTTVGKFASTVQAFTDTDLERPWGWKDYHEGVRFAFFRLCEQLSTLAARLDVERAASACPLTVAQRILGQYHSAYSDLQAVLLGVTDEQAAQAPLEGEWPLRQVLAHIVQADRGFLIGNALGLDHLRAGKPGSFEMTEEIWNDYWASAPFKDLSETGSLSQIQAYYAPLHVRILREFSSVTGPELGLPIRYWEDEPYPLEFRLHRFTSHLRQHTIQVEKTLVMLGLHPTETKRLLRNIFNALAAVENSALGDDCFGLDHQAQLAAEIELLTDEIAQIR